MSKELCEWDPETNSPALIQQKGDPQTGCQNEAVWSLGASLKENWHLCDSCAGLERFKRLRRKVWIGNGERP